MKWVYGPEARASNRGYGQRTRNKREPFERLRMAFPNIDLLSTNRTDTLVQVAKAFTDYTEADYHLVMNTDLSSFFYIARQVSP